MGDPVNRRQQVRRDIVSSFPEFQGWPFLFGARGVKGFVVAMKLGVKCLFIETGQFGSRNRNCDSFMAELVVGDWCGAMDSHVCLCQVIHFNVEESPLVHCSVIRVLHIILVAFNPTTCDCDWKQADPFSDVINHVKVWFLDLRIPWVSDRQHCLFVIQSQNQGPFRYTILLEGRFHPWMRLSPVTDQPGFSSIESSLLMMGVAISPYIRA